uniref:Uncharacterized protein n=1 Tax=Romanomermis culicivorax TaxID=13658 RepID=A0A915K5P9_ROMCU
VLRHHGGIPSSGAGQRSAPRFSSTISQKQQHQQQQNSLPAKSSTLGRRYVKQRSLGPPPSSSSHYLSISNVGVAGNAYCSPVLEER